MDKLEQIVNESVKIAEKAMQKEGFANPKVIVFYRDDINELGTYMADLAPQSYFENRDDIMNKLGEFLATQKGKGIRSFDTLIYFGEANVTVDGVLKQALMVTGLNDKGETMTRFREIQRYILPDHPEKQFFNLQPLEISGFKYASKSLQILMQSFNK